MENISLVTHVDVDAWRAGSLVKEGNYITWGKWWGCERQPTRMNFGKNGDETCWFLCRLWDVHKTPSNMLKKKRKRINKSRILGNGCVEDNSLQQSHVAALAQVMEAYISPQARIKRKRTVFSRRISLGYLIFIIIQEWWETSLNVTY